MPELQVRRLMPGDAYGTADWGLPSKLHSGWWIVERTEAFLRSLDSKRPFFLNLGFQDPHHPLAVPSDFPKLSMEAIPPARGGYDPRLLHLDALAQGTIESSRFGGRFGIAGNQNTRWVDYQEEHKRLVRQYYYTMIELYDRQIGALLDTFRRCGQLENTIFLVTTDHGDLLFDHGIGEKGPVSYEGVLHVPLLISAPGLIAPQTVDEPVSLTDLLPTVLDYAGLPPADCDGLSLRPLLEGREWNREAIQAEFMEEPDAVRYRCAVTKRWKLTIYDGEAFGELYDLASDPGEENNLFFDPAYAPVISELQAQLPPMPRLPLAERPCRC